MPRRGEAARPRDAGRSQPRPSERSIAAGLVAGCRERQRRADRPTGAHRAGVRRRRARSMHPPRRPRRCRARTAGEPRRRSARWHGPWPCPSSSPAASMDRSRSSSPSPPARRASSCRCGPPTTRSGCEPCWPIAGDWLAVGLDARPDRLATTPGRAARSAPTLHQLMGELAECRRPSVRALARRRAPDPVVLRSLVDSVDAELVVAGGVRSPDALAELRDAGVRAVHPWRGHLHAAPSTTRAPWRPRHEPPSGFAHLAARSGLRARCWLVACWRRRIDGGPSQPARARASDRRARPRWPSARRSPPSSGVDRDDRDGSGQHRDRARTTSRHPSPRRTS